MTLANRVRYIEDFPRPGVRFCDMTPLFSKPSDFKLCILNMADTWLYGQRVIIDRIGAFDARGFIFGTALAFFMGLPFFLIRKAGKLPSTCVRESYDLEYGSAELEIHTDALNPGDRILLVDDLLATGGTAAAGVRLVEQLAGVVIGCQFAVEITALGGRGALKSVPRVASLLSI